MGLRTRDAKHFRNADGTYTAHFGHYLHYEAAPGRWDDVDLNLRAVGADFVMDRHDLAVRVGASGVEASERATGKGIRWLTPTRPAVDGRRARITDQGLDWEYATRISGIKLAAKVEGKRGPWTYEFRYALLGGAQALSVDADGGLRSDGFFVPRAFALGSDGTTYPASAWRVLPGQRVAFDFDDTALPTRALPYLLDPTTQFNVATSTDDGYADGYGFGYPPPASQARTDEHWTGALKTKYGDGTYRTANPLMRWNTSSLPDDSSASSATLRVGVCRVLNTEGRSLTADWYGAWPIDVADYSPNPQTSALVGKPLSQIAPAADVGGCHFNYAAGTDNDIALNNGNGVSVTGYTGLRLHLSGGAPAGDNVVTFVLQEHAVSAEPRLVVDYNRNPFGSIDEVSAANGRVHTRGWAIDPDTTAPIDVHVYVGAPGYAITANTYRPDVGAAYPGFGDYHGYDAWFTAPAGTHNVCIYAINVPSGPNPSLGCRSVVVPAPSPPPAPTVSSPTHPSSTTWYSSNDPQFAFSATDATHGINGYSWTYTASATTVPDDVADAASPVTLTDRAEGTGWFHVKARNGANPNLWGETAHFQVNIDSTAPATPSVTAELPHVCTATTWAADNTPGFTWSASDASGINGYSYELNQTQSFTPDDTSEGATAAYTSVVRADGTWWFHVKARNGAGTWGATADCKILIDAGAPAAPVPSSPSHPDAAKWYPSRTADFTWTPGTPAGASPVVAYAHDAPDQVALVRDPSSVSDGPGLTAPPYTVSGDGTWFFHVKAQSGAGTWGPSGNMAINVDVTAPEPPPIVLSGTHPAGVAVSNRSATVNWTPGSDPTSGVAGYSWSFNQDQALEDNGTKDGDALTLSATSASLPNGVSWFHVKTIDNAGNASADKVYGPIMVDPNGPLGLSLTLPPVAEAASDELGLEQFAPYRRVDLGTATGYVHLRTGNAVVTQDETTIPRQGLNAVVRRVYNSTDQRDPDGMGPGWRLSVSDVTAGLEGVAGMVADLDAGAGLTVANLVDNLGVVTGQVLEFSDGDGTTHRFVRPGAAGTRWDSPPGVSLRLREVTGGYELVRPDGVVYRAENVVALGLPQWRVTTVTDRHGNRLTYDYQPHGPLGAMRLAAIHHNRDDAQVLVRFDYVNAKLVGIVALPGLSGPDPADGVVRSWERRSVLGYDAVGRLNSVVRNDQASAAGGRQTTGFSYTNALLSGVTDGRGKTAALTYEGAGNTAKLTVVTDRRAKAWGFAYGAPDANGTQITTATDPTGAKVRYTISPRATLADGRTAGGNIVAMADDGTDAGPVTSTYAWVANRLVSTTNGAGNVTATEYNDLGLPTKLTRPAPNDPGRADLTDPAYPKAAVDTVLTYRYPSGFSYAGCTEPASSGPVTTAGWCQMVADMERSAAADNVAAQRRVTDIDPDPAGAVLSLVRRAAASGAGSADDRRDAFAYFSRGGLCSADGPRADVGDVTRFGDAASTAVACASAPDAAYGGYDATGLPSRVLDALGKASDVAYTPYGKMARSTDRDGRVTTAHYDDRDNVVEVTDPAGSVTTMSYDANDNKLIETSPRGNADTSTAPDDFQTRFSYDDNDWPTAVSWPGATEAAARAQVTTAYNDDGTKATETNAVGGVTTFTYHPNRMVKQVAAPATTSGPKALTDYRYDAAGRVVRTIRPAVDAAGASRPEEQVDYTPQGDVSVRRETSATAGVWRATTYAYNAHGETAQTAGPRSIGAEQEATQVDYNAFGQPTVSRRRLVGRWLSTPTSYDAAGNATSTSTLTGANQALTSTYRYDALGRVAAQTSDPTNPDHEVAFTYEGEGAQLTRVDLRQTAGPSSAACGDAGVGCVAVRTVTHAYNPDATVATSVATDDTGKSLTTCHSPSLPGPAYDADKHPLAVRTFTGTTVCSGGTLQREVLMGYDSRGLLSTMTQKLRGDNGMVTRDQSFTHFGDTTLSSVTHAGLTTNYVRSPAGWTESLTDWRAKVSTSSYSPAGAPTATAVGSGTASSTRTYAPDGMPASALWSAGGATVRSHTALTYDVGGLRTNENVAVVHPLGTVADTGGPASFAYDLARRLVSYTSPYKAEPIDTAEPTTTYTLDDGANITAAATVVAGQTRKAESSTYPGGLLATRNTTITNPATGLPSTTDTGFSYSSLGEERTRTTTTAGGIPPPATTTTGYDAAGHVASADGVTYVYDGTDHLVSRTEGLGTTLYFYWGGGATLAEETDGAGTALARYVVDGGDVVAQHTFRRLGALKDPTDLNGTWTWLLDDPAGNVATQVDDNGAVTGQAAFDPYGAPEKGGKSQAPGSAGTSLGFQAALTDGTTKKVMLGPRQYDPETARFTNPDVYVGGAADVALGADALTGNRFLFAGANPVAYYDDGHCAFGKERTRKVVVDRRNRRDMIKVRDSSRAGYHYEFKSWVEEIEGTKKDCDNLAMAKQAISLVGTGASVVAAGSTGLAAACAASVLGILPCSVPALITAGVATAVSATATVSTLAISCTGQRRGCPQSGGQLAHSGIVFVTSFFVGPTVRFGLNTLDAATNVVGYCTSAGRWCGL